MPHQPILEELFGFDRHEDLPTLTLNEQRNGFAGFFRGTAQLVDSTDTLSVDREHNVARHHAGAFRRAGGVYDYDATVHVCFAPLFRRQRTNRDAEFAG